jgi:hypothetical protein
MQRFDTGESSMIARRSIPLALVTIASCSFPGVRPEGMVQSITGTIPADREAVVARARGWFDRNSYVVERQSAAQGILGFKVLQKDGATETRAVVDFAIRGGSANSTDYTTTYRTVRGVPPSFRIIQPTGAQTAESSLDSWLSCGSARWPNCP